MTERTVTRTHRHGRGAHRAIGAHLGILSLLALQALVWCGAPTAASGQDANVILRADDAERRFSEHAFQVMEFRPLRPGGRARLAALAFPDSVLVWAKWVPAPRGGRADNAEPRYEVAAYRLQKLFLVEQDHVVPPTAVRVVPAVSYPERPDRVRPTFGDEPYVLVVLQLWLSEVTSGGIWNERRLLADTAYARHAANANILTYLIRHGDANTGNLLISRDPGNPRIFSVDNGIAFTARPNPEAHEWMHLRARRLPAATVERLRAIDLADLESALGVVIQLEVRGGELIQVPPGPNLQPRAGVRREGSIIQLGLTTAEIRGVQQRLRALLREVDRGRIQTF
jgi:hypothetical protein